MALVAGSLQLSVQSNVTGVKINPQGTVATPTLALPLASALGTGEQSISFGTASGQCDIYCAADYALTVSGGATPSVTLDLFGGTLLNLFGGASVFAKLKSAFIGIVSGGDVSGVTIGNAATNQLGLWFGAVTNTWTIYPDSPPLVGGQQAGLTVDGTRRNLKIANASAAVVVAVRVILAGSSV